MKDPTGTIRRSKYDARGRVLSQWIGTNDENQPGEVFFTTGSDDMIETTRTEYVTNAPSSGSYKLGTSRTFKQKQDPDGDWTGTTGDQRVTEFVYDYRNRVVVQKAPVSPHSVTMYDFRGRAVASGTYSSTSGLTASTDPTGTTTNRLSLSETSYDGRGQVWRSRQHEITQSTGASASTLDTLLWYDDNRRSLKSVGPGGVMKYAYDRLDRQVRSYTLASADDTSYAHAQNLSGDVVMEETLTAYEKTTGNVLMEASFSRHHDQGTGVTGALDTNADGDDLKITDTDLERSAVVIARAQITAIWYDDLDRRIDTVQFGTYDLNVTATDFDRDGMSVPARSPTAIRTTTVYNRDGTVDTVADPMDVKTQTLYDNAGRRVATISNYDNGTPDEATNGDDDHYVRYAYEAGLLRYMWVDLAGDDMSGIPPTFPLGGSDVGDQITEYVYGTTVGALPASRIATGHLLREVIYPEQSSGQSAGDRTVKSAYNALGEQVWSRDQHGTEIESTFDVGGRQTARIASALGTNIDGAVQRIEMTYTNRGQIDEVVQYSVPSGGTALNGLKYSYHHWGTIASISQDRDSAVGVSGAAAITVSWGTANAAPSGGRPRIQTSSVTLPGSYTVTYDFGGSGTISNLLGRVAELDFPSGGGDVRYTYLGQSMLVGTDLAGPARHSHLFNGSDVYADLDTFNRVTVNRWTNTGNSADIYQLELGYDQNSNITKALEPLETVGGTRVYDTVYTMDRLNRVIKADRGTWTGTFGSGSFTGGSTRFTQDWDLSQTGNWVTSTVDLNGSGLVEFTDARTHSDANELQGRSGTVSGTSAHNKAGQMIDDGTRYTYVYDAFARVVEIKNRSSTNTIVEYVYDGLGQRIGWHYDANASGGGPDASDPWYWFIYDNQWRSVATYRVAGGTSSGAASFRDFSATTDSNPKERFIYHAAGLDGAGGSSYIDCMVVAQRDLSTAWASAADNDPESWHYPLANWRNDTIRIENRSGGILAGYRYTAYGDRVATPVADFNGDGFVDFFDYDGFVACYEEADCPEGATADWSGDGFLDFYDYDTFVAAFYGDVDLGGKFRHLYAGYEADRTLDAIDATTSAIHSIYHVRHRLYSTELGRWTRRDPLGYVDGPSLLTYCSSASISDVDPMGLCRTGTCGPEFDPMYPGYPKEDLRPQIKAACLADFDICMKAAQASYNATLGEIESRRKRGYRSESDPVIYDEDAYRQELREALEVLSLEKRNCSGLYNSCLNMTPERYRSMNGFPFVPHCFFCFQDGSTIGWGPANKKKMQPDGLQPNNPDDKAHCTPYKALWSDKCVKSNINAMCSQACGTYRSPSATPSSPGFQPRMKYHWADNNCYGGCECMMAAFKKCLVPYPRPACNPFLAPNPAGPLTFPF